MSVADRILRASEATVGQGVNRESREEIELRVKRETASYEAEQRAEQLKALQAENQRKRDDMELRKRYASKAVDLAYGATIFWALMFFLSGILRVFGLDFLSDNALIALTSGATINVIAVFLVVVKGLFPSNKSD